MSITSYQEIIDSIESLSIDEQDDLWELIGKRRVEKRRLEIAANARATLESWKQGTAKVGTVEDLIADLLLDDKDDEDSLENGSDTSYRAWSPFLFLAGNGVDCQFPGFLNLSKNQKCL